MEEAIATSPPPCPTTVTVRRNPPRRARPTPSVTNFPTVDNIVAMDDVQQTQNPLPINSNSLKVFLRLRPLPTIFHPSKTVSKSLKSKLPNVKKQQSKSCLTVNDCHSVTISPPCDSTRSKSEIYNGFSHVFSPDSSQDEVYEKLMRPIVEEFLNGKSGLLAAVGPSGSGKTHTVFGSAKDPGLVPRALRHIFNPEIGYESKLSRSFHLSMFEICSERGKGEKLSDLSPDGADICMQQSVVKGLKEVLVSDAAHAESLLAQAMTKRATAMTNSNSRSSRSQCIINIRCAVGEIDGEGDSRVNGAVLTFVDLAGAEREKKTGNQGGRLLESNFINNTSMVFGLCLRSLLEHQKNPKKQLQKHFQSSMLTRYLRDYLEGRKRMALILTVRPGEEDYFDTSFLLRQASPYMEIKFHNMEESSNLVANKRRNQTISTEQQKRVKLSGADACKDYVVKASGESNEVCKEGPLSGYQRDQIPEVISNTVTKDNCIDAKIEREYLVMRGFAKALWNVLKQYKDRVKTAENEIDVLTENLRIEHGRYLVIEKELRDMKAQCSCQSNDSASRPAKIPDSEEASGCIGFRSTSLGGAGLQDPRSTDISQVHHGDPPTVTKKFEFISENSESDATLRKSSLETSWEQSYQVQASLMEYEISHDHVSGVDLHEDLANKDDRKPTDAAACLSQLHGMDLMVVGESSTCNTNGKESEEDVAVGPGSNLWSDSETISQSTALNAEGAKRDKTCSSQCNDSDRRQVETLVSEEKSGLIGSRPMPVGLTVLHGSKSSSAAEVHHGNLPTCTENSRSFDENDESDAILRKTSLGANFPSLDCETSTRQIHQVGPSPIERETSNVQFSRDNSHKKDLSKKGNKESTDAASCLPQLDKDGMVQGESSGCDTNGKDDKENVAIAPGSISSSELATKQTSHCEPLNRGRPKRRLMPASSLLLRDVSGMEIADDSENVKKGKGGQRLVEDESIRSRGNASLLQLLKNRLPR